MRLLSQTVLYYDQMYIWSFDQTVTKINEKLLYARVDGIVIENKLHLMEIELIEPDLYFDLADGARERFVESFMVMSNCGTKPLREHS